jgi:hypothetical protein
MSLSKGDDQIDQVAAISLTRKLTQDFRY